MKLVLLTAAVSAMLGITHNAAYGQAARRMACELTDIQGLGGWSIEPRVYTLNDNLAALSSGTFHRERVETAVTDSDKVKVGVIPGTEVPLYEIKSARDSTAVEIVTVREASYRLPVRARDLPSGARETVLFASRCEVGVGAVVARVAQPKRLERTTTLPAPRPVVAKKAEGPFGN